MADSVSFGLLRKSPCIFLFFSIAFSTAQSFFFHEVSFSFAQITFSVEQMAQLLMLYGY